MYTPKRNREMGFEKFNLSAVLGFEWDKGPNNALCTKLLRLILSHLCDKSIYVHQ